MTQESRVEEKNWPGRWTRSVVSMVQTRSLHARRKNILWIAFK